MRLTKGKVWDLTLGIAVLISLGIGVWTIEDKNDKLEVADAKVETAKPLGEQVREACNRDRIGVELELGISCERGQAVAEELSKKDSEINDPDLNDPEFQDPEIQDTEINDPDPDDPEIQEPEVQESEIQEPELQDNDTLLCPSGYLLEDVFSNRGTPEPEDDITALVCVKQKP